MNVIKSSFRYFVLVSIFGACLKSNHSKIDTLANGNNSAVFVNLEFVLLQISYNKPINPLTEIDSILKISKLDQVILSNNEKVELVIALNEDSSRATITISGKLANTKSVNILLLRKAIRVIPKVDNNEIIKIYDSVSKIVNNNSYSSIVVTEVSTFSTSDNIDRVKHSSLPGYWYLKNIDESTVIEEKYFNRLLDLSIALDKKYDPNYEQNFPNAGGFDNYLFGVSPITGILLYVKVAPSKAFAAICSNKYYYGDTITHKTFIANEMYRWMYENNWVIN